MNYEPSKEKILCNYCSDSFYSLLKHISKSTSCKEKYDMEEIKALHDKAKAHHRMNTKKWKMENKDAVAATNANYYRSHKDAFSLRNQVKPTRIKVEQTIGQIKQEKQKPTKYHNKTNESTVPTTIVCIRIKKRPPEWDAEKKFVVKPVPTLSLKNL